MLIVFMCSWMLLGFGVGMLMVLICRILGLLMWWKWMMWVMECFFDEWVLMKLYCRWVFVLDKCVVGLLIVI